MQQHARTQARQKRKHVQTNLLVNRLHLRQCPPPSPVSGSKQDSEWSNDEQIYIIYGIINYSVLMIFSLHEAGVIGYIMLFYVNEIESVGEYYV